MKTNYLFPNKYKKVGLFVLIPTLIIGIVFFGKEPDFLYFNVYSLFGDGLNIFNVVNEVETISLIEDNIFNEIIGVLLIISSLLVGFSEEKLEDEFISTLRLKSLTRAVYVNYGILLVSFFSVYGLNFAWLAIFNIFTFLLIFISIFNFNLWRFKKSAKDEE